jgi:hypothetical protein
MAAVVLLDPLCCQCGGSLTVVERDEHFMTVLCVECGTSHGIEVEIAPDGTEIYWPSFRICTKGDVSV